MPTITLTSGQYFAIERLRLSLSSHTIGAVTIETPDTEYDDNPDAPGYIRVTLHAAWGGKAVFDIDNTPEANSAPVNGGESEISTEAEEARA